MNGPFVIDPKNAPMQDRGFSLLETLFALVIMSFASLALFQSTSAMLSLSDRAVSAAERTLDGALDRRAIGHWIGKRRAKLNDIGAIVPQGTKRVIASLKVGVARHDRGHKIRDGFAQRAGILDHRIADIAQNHGQKLERRIGAFLAWVREVQPDYAAPTLDALCAREEA